MNGILQVLLIGVGGILAVAVAVIAVVYLVVPLFKGIGWLFKQVFTFIGGELTDALRSVGTVLMVLILTPLAVGSIIIGRWSATAHYGRAIQNEFKTLGGCLYRIAIGHPARLLCLTPLLDGVERRLPEVVAAAPGRDRPKGKAGQFDGYRIVGSLPTGGSGSKLYIAEPDPVKAATFERAGQRNVDKVVIKSFSVNDGSSLPQIVRESRALDAAKKLGLVLDHDLTPERFFYVMRYVPGDSLTTVTQQLHAESGSAGLDDKRLNQALGYVADLVRTLDGYHKGGLWHKDVKPDNIIVDGREAHLVDFGLLSDLRSSMTLTTHGTEYFRDPEMVRMALKGVKVHQVDGAKFDVFAAGAVMFSIVENSFPAHGALSQISKRCPDSVRWIVRRAMTDYDKRYASASQMLTDLDFVRNAADPFAVRPAELPSMRGGVVPDLGAGVPPIPGRDPLAAHMAQHFAPHIDAHPAAGPALGVGSPPPPAPRKRPKIRITDWWTGKYEVQPEPHAPAARAPGVVYAATPMPHNARPVAVNPGAHPVGYQGPVPVGGIGRVHAASFAPARPVPVPSVGGFARTPRVAPDNRRPAREQLERAQARAKAAQDRAHARMQGRLSARRAGSSSNPTGMNAGVGFAAGIAVLIGVGAIIAASRTPKITVGVGADAPAAPVAPEAPASPSDVIRNAATDVRDAIQTGVNQVRDHLTAPAATPEPNQPDRIAQLLASVGAAPATHTGNILVVSDVFVIGSQPHIRRYIQQMEDASEALRRMGFTLKGDAAQPAPPGTDEHNAQVDLISRARASVGALPKGSEAMADALADFAHNHADLAGIIWIWPESQNNPAEFHVAVIGPHSAEIARTDVPNFDRALVGSVNSAFTPRPE